MKSSSNSLPFIPVILSGGSGTRLWPLSRENLPKQLLSLVDEHSLLQNTARRLDGLVLPIPVHKEPIVVCNHEYRFITAEQLQAIDVQASQIILEPIGRNTAPALTLAALKALTSNDDALLLVMASDHVIQSIAEFHTAIQTGLTTAMDGHIVTFGIHADTPETRYGYICTGSTDLYSGVNAIKSFIEKPNAVAAQKYIDSGEYLWNSGIFMLKASTWIYSLTHFAPEIVLKCKKALEKAQIDLDFIRIDETIFADCPNDSIDYAVMEKLSSQPNMGVSSYVVPMDAGWSDVGTWDSVWQTLDKDNDGNAASGEAIFERTSNTYAHSEHKLITCLGVDDLVIVDTADALLVAKKSEVHDLKPLVARVKSGYAHLTEKHRKVFRPWGSYDTISTDERFQVKRITVKPGASLSLQVHHHRAEHWIVVRGTAKVTREDEVFFLNENESTFIPLGVKHRLENLERTVLEVIEVQSGAYLGEDDIIRLSDIYGRNTTN